MKESSELSRLKKQARPKPEKLLSETNNTQEKPWIGVVMGSQSDWETMQQACSLLDQFQIPYEAGLVSAHRTPDWLFTYAEHAKARGLKAIIAGAGGAAHLPGMLAAKTTVPVLGVPIPSTCLLGQDALLSIVQMPKGIPVATFAIGAPGAINAALFAIAMLANEHPELSKSLEAFREKERECVLHQVLSPNQ